mmetsp:Transcript_39279/g.80467  ORF Transcript_39279/g.80467 Transcript_39279/m.80467 type:complete len:142 (-) Transcript_39279:29-454(-)|eukprot:CAMPEP_0181311076 /NCGR_PEP_ID=MMETSP1101-20121128/12937_1 /TAXON_ID=46948 /ORGANISM="Rhodomonas abbreviata, Strain Caron Lab Isolate" /LENGTH=141 /DNA_ID=CAMNT_0023417769 /DNA_START=372 /DNA_END=797 /DNA_ORIENTATION=-
MAARMAVARSGAVVRVIGASAAIKAIDEAAKGLREILSPTGPLAEAAAWLSKSAGRTDIRVYNGCGDSVTVWIEKEFVADVEDGKIDPEGFSNWGRGEGTYVLTVRGAVSFDGKIKMSTSNCIITATPEGLSIINAELLSD